MGGLWNLSVAKNVHRLTDWCMSGWITTLEYTSPLILLTYSQDDPLSFMLTKMEGIENANRGHTCAEF